MMKRLIKKMDNRHSPLRALLTAFLLALAFGLYGCMSPDLKPVPPPVDLVWPSGGERPRIRFISSISRPEDFQITPGALMRFWNFVIGKENDTLVAPYGVTVDSGGRMFVVDTYQRRVQLFDTTAGDFSVFPADDRPMTSPIGIAVDKNGRAYVTDSQDGMVKIFNGADDTTPITIGDGLLQRPTGIAINPTNNELLVVDTKLDQIFRFDLDNHQLKGSFGVKGVETGQFNNPTNIAVTVDGALLITDSLNFRIQIFSAQGEFLGTFGSAGDSPGHFSRPRGVASDSDGNIYVADALFDNIQIFNKTGRLLMDFGKPGHEYGEFWMPAGLWIDKNDKIYVADSYNKRIQIFQYLKEDGALQ